MHKFVLVEWDDATQTEAGWQSPADIDHAPVRVHTVGFLVKKTKDYLLLAGSHNTEMGDVEGVSSIHMGNVKKIHTFDVGDYAS